MDASEALGLGVPASPLALPTGGPLVSVIVPTHNYAHFIREALESVFAQTYLNTEVVVVDDGSTDNTPDVVTPFLDRMTYVRQTQAGPGPARNAGLAATTGPLIAFLDADDAWLPEKLSVQVAYMQEHPEIALVGGAYFQCDEKNRPRNLEQPPSETGNALLERLLVKNVVRSPTVVMVRRSCLEAIGGFSDYEVGQDWETWIRIAKRFPVGFVSLPIAKKRGHSNKHTRRAGLRKMEVELSIINRHTYGLQPQWKQALLRRRAMSVSTFNTGATTIANDDKKLARTLILRSLWLDPVTAPRRKLASLLRFSLPESSFLAVRRAIRRLKLI